MANRKEEFVKLAVDMIFQELSGKMYVQYFKTKDSRSRLEEAARSAFDEASIVIDEVISKTQNPANAKQTLKQMSTNKGVEMMMRDADYKRNIVNKNPNEVIEIQHSSLAKYTEKAMFDTLLEYKGSFDDFRATSLAQDKEPSPEASPTLPPKTLASHRRSAQPTTPDQFRDEEIRKKAQPMREGKMANPMAGHRRISAPTPLGSPSIHTKSASPSLSSRGPNSQRDKVSAQSLAGPVSPTPPPRKAEGAAPSPANSRGRANPGQASPVAPPRRPENAVTFEPRNPKSAITTVRSNVEAIDAARKNKAATPNLKLNK